MVSMRFWLFWVFCCESVSVDFSDRDYWGGFFSNRVFSGSDFWGRDFLNPVFAGRVFAKRANSRKRIITGYFTSGILCRKMEPILYDLFVIGAGSGGMAAARRAAAYGVKVAIGEGKRLGGTCVNVGCVPKKVMWNAGALHHILNHDLSHYGFQSDDKKFVSCDYGTLKKNRDKYVERLNGIYRSNLEKSQVKIYEGFCSLKGENEICVANGNETHNVKAKHILIATGGKSANLNIPGEDLCINSDQFFELTELPKKVAVIGAGYIAVELAGVFRAFGVTTHLFTRGDTALRNFDHLLKTQLHQEMITQGIQMHPGSIPTEVVKEGDTLTLKLKNGQTHSGFNQILVAIGRDPLTDGLELEKGKVLVNDKGHVRVDEFQNTSSPSIFALGDVCGKVELTPMAIAAGRRLADRLYGGMSEAKADYDKVTTVVFSHPPLGTVGLTEAEAEKLYGKENIRVYTTSAVNLYYGVFQVAPSEKPKTHMKLICKRAEKEVILGAHVIGMGADEMIQGFGVAVKMGATKQDFDNCIAVHPTAAEEFVTIPPWGLREDPKPQ